MASYGLTIEKFDEMMADQEGECRICQNPLQPGKGTHIEHCHESGIVRGLLCGKCNTAIGLLDDSPDRAQALAEYLRIFL